jgi:hypothetical protein
VSEEALRAEPDPFHDWVDALEGRHLRTLTFQEVRRGVQALSRAYVEARGNRLRSALSGAGKRAAFAYFRGPLHFLTVREVIRQLGAGQPSLKRILDLGCGTGVGGAAWALETSPTPDLMGIERNRWAAGEARWTWRTLGLRGSVRTTDLESVPLPGRRSGILLAYTANELEDAARERLGERLLDAAGRGAAVLVVEPIARGLIPWWDDWTKRFKPTGGRVDRWRLPSSLPEKLLDMDRAAGLDHRELTARSMWIPGDAPGVR